MLAWYFSPTTQMLPKLWDTIPWDISLTSKNPSSFIKLKILRVVKLPWMPRGGHWPNKDPTISANKWNCEKFLVMALSSLCLMRNFPRGLISLLGKRWTNSNYSDSPGFFTSIWYLKLRPSWSIRENNRYKPLRTDFILIVSELWVAIVTMAGIRLIVSDFILSFMWVWQSVLIKIFVYKVLGLGHAPSGEVFKCGLSIISMFLFAFLGKVTKGGAYNPLTVLASGISGDFSNFLFTVGARIPAQVSSLDAKSTFLLFIFTLGDLIL